jgi:hypothetical protein
VVRPALDDRFTGTDARLGPVVEQQPRLALEHDADVYRLRPVQRRLGSRRHPGKPHQHPAGGRRRSHRAVRRSGSLAAIATGVPSVIQISWNAAVPISSVFGVAASESTTELPEASWPVTIRRGATVIGS